MKYNFITKPLSSIADIQTGPFGSQLHKEDYVDIGTPIVTVEHLGNKRFTEQNLPYVSHQDKQRLNKYVLQEGDIVFSRVGSVDRCSFVSKEYSGWMFSGRCLRVRPNDEIDPQYLYYYFTLKATKQFVRGIATGATMPSINTRFMGEVPIAYPSKEIQHKIAGILSEIDDKIQVNRNINENLEQQAESYFYYQFIANMDPSWQVGTISDLGTIIGGGTPSKTKAEYYTDNGIAWITPKDLSVDKSKFIAHGAYDITELGLRNSSATIMPAGTVLFSSRAPIGYIAIADGEVSTNQGFKSVIPFNNVGTAFVYYFLKNALPSIKNMASGSTFKEISGSAMRTIPACLPDSDSLREFSAFCEPLFQQQRTLEAESRSLVAIRDSLLPRLMSGDLDVSSLDLL